LDVPNALDVQSLGRNGQSPSGLTGIVTWVRASAGNLAMLGRASVPDSLAFGLLEHV
jgi:hypothetical protein